MFGYYKHPAYFGGAPILSASEKQKRALFSFYYPGEALLGLALYEREVATDPLFKTTIKNLSKKALDFLVEVRPERYANLFASLPSDGWLMQAIEEFAYYKEFQKKTYLDFVFNDAQAMLNHRYTGEAAMYYDYPGSFFYRYGDVSYPDGARAEGLIAAYYLARRMKQDGRAEDLLNGCTEVAEALMYTFNSSASTYMYPYPEKGLGAFRFKYTRQWMRIDSVQHTACFFIRLYMVLTTR